MKYIIFLSILCACMPKPDDEMSLLGQEVLKNKRGLKFDIEPGDPESK